MCVLSVVEKIYLLVILILLLIDISVIYVRCSGNPREGNSHFPLSQNIGKWDGGKWEMKR